MLNTLAFQVGDLVQARWTTGSLIADRIYEIVMVKSIDTSMGGVYCDYHVIDTIDRVRFKVRNGHILLKPINQ